MKLLWQRKTEDDESQVRDGGQRRREEKGGEGPEKLKATAVGRGFKEKQTGLWQGSG